MLYYLHLSNSFLRIFCFDNEVVNHKSRRISIAVNKKSKNTWECVSGVCLSLFGRQQYSLYLWTQTLTIMARCVSADDSSKELWVMPLDSGNSCLAGCRGICPGPHQLHGQVTVGRITCSYTWGKLNERCQGHQPGWWRGCASDYDGGDKSDAKQIWYEATLIKCELKIVTLPPSLRAMC